jgi:hypothetical protein
MLLGLIAYLDGLSETLDLASIGQALRELKRTRTLVTHHCNCLWLESCAFCNGNGTW